MSSVALWVKPDAFDFGAIHAPLPPKLTLHNLYKLSIYARNKGKAGYPKLSYSVWKHVACNKLQITEDLAWLYFETFDMLSGSSFKEHTSWNERFAQCKSEEEVDHLRSQGSVRTLQFILFLYIQQIHKISFKASLVLGGEEWPTRSRSPDLENKGSVAVKSLDEHDHMMFVLHHLNDILELLMEPESSANNGCGSEACLTVEALDALGFFIAGARDSRAIQPLHEIARLQSEGPISGYSKISRTFSFRQLQFWLRSNLQVNPFGVSSILAHGFKQQETYEQNFLSLSDTFDEHSLLRHQDVDHSSAASKEHSTNRSRIMSNVSYAPPEQRVIILSQVCKQTVAKASDSYSGSMVKIHRCHYSYIYILCPLRAVTVENCHNSTIVLGVTKTAVNIIGCDSCTIFAVCGRISFSGCSNCTFNLCTPTRPVILPGNEKLVLAPYHTYYPTLEEHLNGPWGTPTEPNLWNDPLVLASDRSEGSSTVFRELPAQDFFTFTIPFSMKGSTDGPPIPLPKKYEKALKEREKAINNWYQVVKTSSLSKAQRRQLQKDVQDRFQVLKEIVRHSRRCDERCDDTAVVLNE